MIWIFLGTILCAILGLLLLAVLMLFVAYVAGSVLIWLDRLADRWAFRHTHRLEITKRPDGYEIHQWKRKEHTRWDC